MNIDISNKTALVCGSSQGIGKAIAVELALLGANVILFARNESGLKEVVELLNTSKGQQHEYLVADFNNVDNVKQMIEDFVAKGNIINILVNNSGGPSGGPITEAGEEEFLETFKRHLLCNQVLVKAVKEGMITSGYGRIVNIISTSVKEPLAGLGVSNTIRGAVASWAKTMAGELGPHGITVNNVLPGATNTVRLESLIEIKSKKTGQSVDEIKGEWLNKIPMNRFADASEIANAVAFLVSPAAGYINGINLPVDGGRTGCL
ncbi:MAG: SDR family oxidoreductase [Bacteroidia bacterium]|nr:SDR family oxidoreductase [Bacteroidia bacterium]